MKDSFLTSSALVPFSSILLALIASNAGAETWNGSISADWATGTNWIGAAVPTGNTLVNTATGNVATISSVVTQQPTVLRVGDGASGNMNLQTGGSLAVNGELWLGNGNGGSGILNMDGGSLTVGNFVVLGRLAGSSNGTMDITGGTLTKNGAGNFIIGEGFTTQSSLNVTNASVGINTGQLWVGQGGKGGVNLGAGGSIVANDWVVVARSGGQGEFNMTGGTFTTGGADLRIGEAGTGLYNLTGGTSTVGTVRVGSLSTGSSELRISGTGQMTATSVLLGSSGSVSGTVNLNGGTLVADSVTSGAGVGANTFNFNGGKLLANASFTVPNAENFTTVVNAGGAAIHTGAFNVVWNAGFLAGTGNGGLLKQGSGKLTLANVNTYKGPTTVTDGELVVTAAGFSDSSALTIGAVSASGAKVTLNFSGEDLVHSLVIDGVTMTPGVYDAATHPLSIGGTGSVRVISPFSTWAEVQGLDGSVGFENGFTDDPDGDCISNGLEWIFGGSPLVADSPSILPTIGLNGGNLSLKFNRADSAVQVASLIAQWGVDLTNWHNIPVSAAGSSADPDGAYVTVATNGAAPDSVSVVVPDSNAEDGRLFTRLVASAPGTEATIPGPPVTLGSLLAEMTTFGSIARWPSPEFTCLQASSHDRLTVAPDQAGWFANDDNTKFIRDEVNDGRTERVMMDSDGPGTIVRFWITTIREKLGTMRIYLDHSTTPTLIFPSFDLLSGNLNLPESIGIPHPGYTAAGPGGSTLMLPIPYSKHCKVTWEEKGGGPRFYQINYRKYARGSNVETLTPQRLEAARPAIVATGDLLLAPPSATGTPSFLNTIIAGGAEVSLDLPAGPAAVKQMSLQISAPTPAELPAALRATIVKIQFDGENTVWCPAGDFFGSGAGLNVLNNWYRTVSSNGTMTCRWTMPYARSARVTLLNAGDSAVEVNLNCLTGPWTFDELSMHFHSAWHYEGNLRTPPATDWNFIQLDGRGVYVGDTLSLYNEVATWYGEGDEKIRVDNETLPSHLGTGTEDYYNYSFAPRGIMQTPFANQTRVDEARTQGHNVMTRSRNLDGIPFKKSLDFDIELISWAPTRMIYAATTHWYAFPGGSSNIAPDVASATAYIPTLADAQVPPAAFPGALDAEIQPVESTTAGLVIETQNMQGFGYGVWSRGAQLLGRGTAVGQQVTLNLAAPDAAPRKVYVVATRASDFGTLSFTVNGQSAAGFDGYGSSVTHPEDVLLGTFTPVDGKFQIRVEVSGTNPASTGARHYFGLDYFRVETP